ncbi:MAG: hypothetical protein IKA17_08130 [Clostridia bacterium]|nr:hypothetical protein [Clostridia bacterium]
MKKFSKILSMILCLSLVMASTLIPTSASANTTAVDTSAYIFYDDVQGETVGNAPSQWQLEPQDDAYRFSLTVREESGNKFIRVTRGATDTATVTAAYARPHVKSTTPFSIPVTNNTDTIVVEAKMRASTLDYYHMLRLMPSGVTSYAGTSSFDTSGAYALIKTTTDGKMNGVTMSYSTGMIREESEITAFAVNTWYPVKCVINLDAKKVDYYYNGTCVATGTLTNNKAIAADIAEIGFTIGLTSANTGNTTASTMDIDDIKIYKPAGRPAVTAASNNSVTNPEFTLQFDKAIDEASLNANTVKLYKGATEVGYTGSYNATAKTYTLTDVNASFAAGDVYQIKLTEGVYAANDALFRENGKLTGGEAFEGYIGYSVGTTYLNDTLETGETTGNAPTKWMLADTANASRHSLTVREENGNKYARVTRGTSDTDSSGNVNYRPHVHNTTALAIPFSEGTGKLVIEAKMRASNLEYDYMLRVTDDSTKSNYGYLSSGLWDAVSRFALVKARTDGKLYGQASGTTHPAFTELSTFAANTWYPVKLVIDLDTKDIQYYINNAFVANGSVSHSDDMASITNLNRLGFTIAFSGGTTKGNAATLDFDDVAVYSLNRVYNNSEIIYGQSALTSGDVTPSVVWVNNTGESKDIKVYSVLYKKVGEGLAIQSVASTNAVTVAADGVYDGKAPTVNVPETEDDFVVKTFVWTTGFAPVMEAGTLD